MDWLNQTSIRRLFNEHFPLLGILIGSALFTFTAGPFQNWDSAYEFSAASGILKYGVPYTGAAGSMINQPPLGFYVDSPFLRVFGLSFNTGVAVITCFGLWLRTAGLLDWQSLVRQDNRAVSFRSFRCYSLAGCFFRSFLIDVQCLFFSLLFLLIGFYAIRKDSFGPSCCQGSFWVSRF